MSVYVARPDVGTLMFRLFGRPLHPELLVTHAHSRVVNALWTAEFTLCPAGHVVSFHHKKGTLCEVVSSSNTELPTGRLVISRVLKGNRNESVEHDGGILYHMSHQVEYLEPDIFLTLHEELLLDSSTSQLAHLFPAPSRIAPAPLSYIQTEVHSKSLLVHAFHTFPENGAIVKTQSLFEI